MLFLSLNISPMVWAKALLFKQSADTEFPMGQLGHLMDLAGAWSVALSSSADSKIESKAYMANAVIPFSSNIESLLHGYYLSPTYFSSEGSGEGTLKTLGNTGWQLMFGRANLNVKGSAFRGFLTGGYRESTLSTDSNTEDTKRSFGLSDSEEKKRSIIFSTGVSSTQSSLISQKKPLIDSELLLNLRYDYEKGDLYTHVKAAAFYPTWVDIGASIAWFKSYRENENAVYNEVSDDFIFGPRIRGRAWNQLAFDASVEWHAYRDFNSGINIPNPRALFSLIANF